MTPEDSLYQWCASVCVYGVYRDPVVQEAHYSVGMADQCRSHHSGETILRVCAEVRAFERSPDGLSVDSSDDISHFSTPIPSPLSAFSTIRSAQINGTRGDF